MMRFSQLLIIAVLSVTKCECDAKSRVVITRAKQYFPTSSQKVSFSNYQSYGPPFLQPGNPITVDTSLTVSPTIPTFSRGSFSTSGSFSQSGSSSFATTSHSIIQPNDNYSGRREHGFPHQISDNISPISENFLHVTSQGFQQTPLTPLVPLIERRPSVPQSIPIIGPVLFGPIIDSNEELLEQDWNAFKTSFNKTYNSFEEDRQRREIFIENRNKIARFNQEYGNGRHTFVQKMNQYGDLLNHEFSRLINGFNRTSDGTGPERKNSAYIAAANVALPTHVDWREVGAVSPVKRQGMCGACYAFSAAGAIEGQTFRKTGRLVELSPQNLIDCTKSYSNKGCASGVMEYAYEYVRDNRGIDTEQAYPYEGTDAPECRYRHDGYGAHDTGYILLDEGDEKGLETAVATMGPVSVAIDAHPETFQFYSNGIYYEPQCTTDKLNHGVLVVGYGTEADGQQYWLVKNSYGPEWGIGGYMKLPKFYNSHCGIASYATYPLV